MYIIYLLPLYCTYIVVILFILSSYCHPNIIPYKSSFLKSILYPYYFHIIIILHPLLHHYCSIIIPLFNHYYSLFILYLSYFYPNITIVSSNDIHMISNVIQSNVIPGSLQQQTVLRSGQEVACWQFHAISIWSFFFWIRCN